MLEHLSQKRRHWLNLMRKVNNQILNKKRRKNSIYLKPNYSSVKLAYIAIASKILSIDIEDNLAMNVPYLLHFNAAAVDVLSQTHQGAAMSIKRNMGVIFLNYREALLLIR